MHYVGLVEGTAVDADAEVSAGCKREAGAGPEEEEAHGARDYGGYTKGYG